MQNFNIIKKQTISKKSYRVAQIYDQFDMQENIITENFKGAIDIPDSWNIGVIVGKSGSDKSSIAKELFSKYICEFQYNAESVIDDFEEDINADELFYILSSVGFSSPPSWLKTYYNLSNGEKMRIDLARALCQKKEIIAFDEYTSVIDREVARIGSLAVQKTIRKLNKKFIAITCHFDVIEWLQPDWIFSTDSMTNLPRGQLCRRPEIKIEIKRVKGYWEYFRRYHYLNHEINKSGHEYVGFYNDKPIAFCSVINFPHPIHHHMWKIHRIVVLPDYQGIGISKKMMIAISNIYKPEYFGITTSLNNFAKMLMKDNRWILIRSGRTGKNKGNKSLNKSLSFNRNTYSFRFLHNGVTCP
jgi:GNAT superfamily N-acetyltransferase